MRSPSPTCAASSAQIARIWASERVARARPRMKPTRVCASPTRLTAGHDRVLAAHRAVAADHAALADAGRDSRGGPARDRVDPEADGGAAGSLPDRLGQVRAVHHADVRAERGELGEEGLAPHHVHGLHAARPSQPDHEAADRGVGHVLDDPVARPEGDEVGEQQERGRRVDAEHRGLEAVEVRGNRDDVVALHAAPLRPVLALQVDHPIARPDVRDPGADRGDAPDALGADPGRQRGPQAIGPAAHREVRRVDRKGEHVEDDLARCGRADVRDVHAAHRLRGGPVTLEQDLLHRAAGSAGLRAMVVHCVTSW